MGTIYKNLVVVGLGKFAFTIHKNLVVVGLGTFAFTIYKNLVVVGLGTFVFTIYKNLVVVGLGTFAHYYIEDTVQCDPVESGPHSTTRVRILLGHTVKKEKFDK